ncbi:endonuclease/exonuclease/phosphatase family protein [Cytobacillus depressus]|uniref:Endonuclease/exonuclease/phosphatase family protein n=1 Tax=Cytobacillus depressus TaxID=1602942 RepID=A0A6L3V3T2_9BACI|nr:endonuclease/exonuclease/phosphatase family protein [Cytobacillus depressus]KAB2332091.1 endonuclease/exonuclease/phosphatase family protein [Cytobacillus depressus]
MRTWGKVLFSIVISIVVLLSGFLFYISIADYKPDDEIALKTERNQPLMFNPAQEFSITTFNIGYGGLDKNENFFMDGGSNSRASSKEKVEENMRAMGDFLKKESSDFYFLQEVDRDSTRSFHVNEEAYVMERLPQYSSTFAQNYLVKWVPVPITKPHGAVNSGLVTLAKYHIEESTRFALKGQESWPRQLFELDRCMLEQRIPLTNGKELLLINAHLSAYDKGGQVRKQQLGFISDYLTEEYEKGNYIIIGGDWNHSIPGTDPNSFPSFEAWPDWLQMIPGDFLPEGFQWVADRVVPTSRTIAESYIEGENFLSIIDGFLISSNIKLVDVKGHSLNFEHSDHNPVTAIFKLIVE